MNLSHISFPLRVDEDLKLELFSPLNVQELYSLVDKNRLHLRKWLPWLDTNVKEEDSLKFIQESLQKFQSAESLVLSIKQNSKIIGAISFHALDWEKEEGNIGYWIDEDFQGKGIVTRACKKLISLGFQELDLKRIRIDCAFRNKRSRSIPERLKFQEEFCCPKGMCLYGTYVDSISYGVLAQDWNEEF